MNGSISRSIFAARIARCRRPGIRKPLTMTVTTATSATSQPKSCSRSSGSTPSTIPCTATARMTCGTRLPAERQQVQAHRHADQEVQRRVQPTPPFLASSRANRHSRNAAVRSSGTRRNAKRAVSDSTSPMATVTAKHGADKRGRRRKRRQLSQGQHHLAQQHGEEQELKRGPVQDHRQAAGRCGRGSWPRGPW